MISVDDGGKAFPSINHSPWFGITIADFVMPFFLFVVGVSVSLLFKKVSNIQEATKKVVLRSIKLFLLGLILQDQLRESHYRFMQPDYSFVEDNSQLKLANFSGYFHGCNNLTCGVDLNKIRVMGVLQVYCGVRGSLEPPCNAVGLIDRFVLGQGHLHQRPVYTRTLECCVNSPDYGPLPPNAPGWCRAPFDPEDILSSLMAAITCFVGLHYGHILVHFKVA